jgi:hypothetical protein
LERETELGQKMKCGSTCADLIGSLKMMISRKNHPERFPNWNCRSKHDWNCSRINYCGKIPFTGTFATFQQEGYMIKFVNQ